MRASPLKSSGLPGPAVISYLASACVFRTALFRKIGGYEPHTRSLAPKKISLPSKCCRQATGSSIASASWSTIIHRPRDSGLRRRLLARNAAYVGWLRSPWQHATRATLAALRCFAIEGTLHVDG